MRRKPSKSAFAIVVLVVLCSIIYAAKDCPNCGTENSDEAKYCKSCGYEFEATGSPGPRTQPLLRVQVGVEGGKVVITSTPSEATVTVDGRRRGTTPLVLEGLAPGQHELAIERSGYRTYYGVFVMQKQQGSMAVTTVPVGAEVLLDGESHGEASAAGLIIEDVAFGDHTLTARMPGWLDAVQTVTLSAEKPVGVVTIRLDTQLGFLRVQSTPTGADVLVEEQKVGVSDYLGAWAPDRYRLSLSKPGFQRWSDVIEVARAETTFVAVGLVRPRVRPAFLFWTGAAAMAGAVVGIVMGEAAYGDYRSASPPDYTPGQIADLRQRTKMWDLVRNVAAGVGIVGIGVYFAF